MYKDQFNEQMIKVFEQFTPEEIEMLHGIFSLIIKKSKVR